MPGVIIMHKMMYNFPSVEIKNYYHSSHFTEISEDNKQYKNKIQINTTV